MPTVIEVELSGSGVGVEYNETAMEQLLSVGDSEVPESVQQGSDVHSATEEDRSSIDEDQVGQLVLHEVNNIRADRGLSKLRWNTRVSSAADSHAKDMSEKGYLSHTSRDGQTVRARYPCTAGENIAQTWVNRRLRLDDGSTGIYTTNGELAVGIVRQWMNSEGHRKLILTREWVSAGVGISISNDGEVYAVLGFCSA